MGFGFWSGSKLFGFWSPHQKPNQFFGVFSVQIPAERDGGAGIETDPLVFPFVSAGDQKIPNVFGTPPPKTFFCFLVMAREPKPKPILGRIPVAAALRSGTQNVLIHT